MSSWSSPLKQNIVVPITPFLLIDSRKRTEDVLEKSMVRTSKNGYTSTIIAVPLTKTTAFWFSQVVEVVADNLLLQHAGPNLWTLSAKTFSRYSFFI